MALGTETRGNPGPQPPASNMFQLVKQKALYPLYPSIYEFLRRYQIWKVTLATIAQTWAQQCLNEHDFCRDISKPLREF